MKAPRRINGKIVGAYSSWRAMKARCNNPKDKSYDNYGGRGITYDTRWESYDTFYEDMGERPAKYTLDRIDTNGNYTKSNCRWADTRTQNINKRTVKLIDFNGELMDVVSLANKLGVSSNGVRNRLKKGFGLDFTESMIGKSNRKKVIRNDGKVFNSVSSAAYDLGVRQTTISEAIKRNSLCQGYRFKFHKEGE